ncbi:acetyltransferase [Candidatus Methylospira mobilis]|uniref:Acetyltransferase n=1 Tax=Candidatus Methylospira mobilis TaxID=1808979 RepID=A0A5Q0BC87_9GAMM|nr:acetyltransferase [Candidatus Methylospira mobilis]QFY41400.1 acetyltransferase [Candidatus Methylospira mobilis]
MSNPLVIFGAGESAEIAHYYFTHDSPYTVAAFAVDGAWVNSASFCGLPLVAFEQLPAEYPPQTHDLFIATGYSGLNQLRREKYLASKEQGYRLASYLSSRASLLNEGRFGDNCFILEDNTVQPFVRIGSNVTLWSGNHIGHHSIIRDHCFLASHIVIAGGVEIGESCFIGINATLRGHIKIGEKCVIGAGALLLSDAEPYGVYMGNATERSRVPSNRLKKI